MLRLMNLIQIEGFTKILNEIISNYRAGVVFQCLKVPNQLKRFLMLENFLTMLLFTVRQPKINNELSY